MYGYKCVHCNKLYFATWNNHYLILQASQIPCGPDVGDAVKEVNLASPLSLTGQAGISSQ